MNFESYVKVCDNADEYIKPGCCATVEFDGNGLENADRLFFTGESMISYFWKSEPDYELLYRRIDDALSSKKARRNRFCLDMSGGRCRYEKLAMKKLVAPFVLSYIKAPVTNGEWTFGVSVKANDLKIYGYLRITLEVRLEKEGKSRCSTLPAPDAVYTIDIPEGSYDWRELEYTFTLDGKKAANVCYYVEGTDYEGEVYFEQPLLATPDKQNIMPQFAPHSGDKQLYNWFGQNLSRVEWQDMKIDINGTTVFDGQVFERCHRFSEWEVTLPKGVVTGGKNTVTFTCLSDYRDAAGYNLREVGFIVNSPSRVIVPENVTAGQPFFVTVDGNKGETLEFCSELVKPLCDLTLKTDGLNALAFVCDKPAADVAFTLGGESCTVSRCVERTDDGVVTGSGDMLYINSNPTDYKNFIKWYLSNNIGNLLTMRPTYRWCGTRVLDSALWRTTAEFLDAAGISYSHMLDGRELPGGDCNPSFDTLDTPHFLGRQTHEFDGHYSYWGCNDLSKDINYQMFLDLFLRMFKKNPENTNLQWIPENIRDDGDSISLYRSLKIPHDMQTAAEEFVQNLKNTRYGSPRHTGPTTLFKYFYQAGYDWTGAELMYSPTEPTAAAIRGARDVYGGNTGAHLAVQWSSTPHDTESHYRRYRLALYSCYIQDIDEINTEEGLWRLEECYNYHNRFSPACINHTKQQQDFYRYVTTHTRSGRFYTPIAFLSGRYDGWRCFSRGRNTWGISEFGFTDIEKSWDLLTYYYPKSRLDALYRHYCPDEPVGYYTGTPHGNVDITPVEADGFSNYRLLVACGYNKAEAEDMQKLERFVTDGGTLVIGWPQLSVTTDRKKAVSLDHWYIDGKVRVFVDDTFEGAPVSVCTCVDFDEVVVTTDSGRPLVGVKKLGDGTVYLVNAKQYAGSAAVDNAYRKVLDILTPACLERESVYAKGDSNIQFSVYKNDDGSTNVYFLATEWYKEDPSGEGTLVLEDCEYTVPVKYGQLVKIAAFGKRAIYPQNDENEVISFDGNTARVQGIGHAQFVLLADGKQKTVDVDFTADAVKNINFGE